MSDYNTRVIRKAIRVYGAVQGVGFRYRAVYAANTYGVTGWVCNEPDGSVSMEMQGTEEQIDLVFLSIMKGTYISIDRMDARTVPVCEDSRGFAEKEV